MKQLTKKDLYKKKATAEEGHWEGKHFCNCRTRNIRKWLAKKKYGDTEKQQSISEAFDDVLNALPEGTLDVLPEDGASQVDHYVYGTPRK